MTFEEQLPYPTLSHEYPLNTKLITRDETNYALSVPTRKEVRKVNYERRKFQQQNEGLYTPLGKPFRALGHPVHMNAKQLIKDAIGVIPTKPLVLRWADDENTHPICTSGDSSEAETPVPEYDTLKLTTDSARKSLEPLRPSTGKSDGTEAYGEQRTSLYMKRRKKQGYCKIRDILFESNASVGLVKRGASFFGLLNKEAIEKVTQFWTERERYEDQRRTQIMPPNRLYLDTQICGLNKEKYTNSAQSLLIDEKRLEEIEAQEDALLANESEMTELTMNLLKAGWNPPEHIRRLILGPDLPRSATMPSTSEQCQTTVDARAIRTPKSVSPAVVRRRRRLRAQWMDEQPRPFTPIHLNICRPGIGRELRVSKVEARLKSAPVMTTTRTPVVEQTTVANLSGTGDVSNDRQTEDLLYSQLCCLHWLLEQMIHGTNDSLPSPIALVNRLKATCDIDTTHEQTVEAHCMKKPGLVQQQWFQFIHGTDGLMRLRKKIRKMSVSSNQGLTVRTLESARSWRTGSFADHPEEGALPPGSNSAPINQRRKSSQAASRDQLDRSNNTTANRSELTSGSSLCQASVEFGLTSTNNSPNGLASSRQRPVQFDDGMDDLTSETGGHTHTSHPNIPRWITARDVRDRYSRETLSEIAKQIELDLEKENTKERSKQASRISEKQLLTSVSTEQTSRAEFKSDQWNHLVGTMRSQLTTMQEQMSMEFQDRLMYMRELRSQICLGKYLSIPLKVPVHAAIEQLHEGASYNLAVNRLVDRHAERKQLAVWFVDLTHDLADLQNDEKIGLVLKKLLPFAQLPVSQFTVTQFIRVLRTLTVWELCTPMISSAVEFVRSRILDITLEEHVEWLKNTYPSLSELLK